MYAIAYYRRRRTALFYAIGYYRRRRGLSQEQLAEAVGISRQHMAAIESRNMDRGLSLSLLFRLAQALEVEPYVLLKFGTEE